MKPHPHLAYVPANVLHQVLTVCCFALDVTDASKKVTQLARCSTEVLPVCVCVRAHALVSTLFFELLLVLIGQDSYQGTAHLERACAPLCVRTACSISLSAALICDDNVACGGDNV
jgi:hypothetical protein